MRALRTTRPKASRSGLSLSSCPSSRSAPVRSFGPARSTWMRQCRPVCLSAARRWRAIAFQLAASSCAQLMRMTSIPASSSSQHQLRIVRRLARHGHHDARGAGLRRRTQQGARVVGQQQRAGAQVHRPRRMWRHFAAGQPRQVRQHRVDAGERAGFHVRQRRQAAADQVGLQRADVVAAHAEVVQQIARAGAVGRLDGLDVRGMRRFQLQRRGADRAERAQQALQHARVEGVGELRCRCIRRGTLGFIAAGIAFTKPEHAPGL